MTGLEGDLTGRVLVDRYRVGEPIGRGGMGIVYRARDERLDRDVALKVITVAVRGAGSREALRSALRREARIAAGIRHPNVVTIFDHGSDPRIGVDFLVMELLEGEDLGSRVRRSGLPRVESLLSILREAAAGLAAGHQAGLVHRDVKPANLFIEEPRAGSGARLRVLDFGIAGPAVAMMSPPPGGGRDPLTPAFASPEQLGGAGQITAASDVFGLGLIGLFLATGRRPAAGVGGERRMAEIQGALDFLVTEGRIPPPVLRILARSLAADPAARYPTAAELLRDLERWGFPRFRDGVTGGEHGDGPSGPALAPWPAGSAGNAGNAGRTGAVPSPSDELTHLHEPHPPAGAEWAGEAPALPRPPGRVRTAFATILALGAWLLALTALPGAPGRAAAALLVSSFATPLAVHSLAGRRTGLRFAVLAATSGSAIAALLLLPGGGAGALIPGVIAAQAALSLLAVWIARDPIPDEPTPTPEEPGW
jgi:eukaryotic-like serine/threonine-protein kinase